MFCEIIVDVESKQVNRTFDYIIPFELEDVLEVGYRVLVPFGGRKVMGFVVRIKDTTTFDVNKMKSVLEIVDLFKPLNQEFVDLAYYMAEHNFSFYATCLETMIPSALKMKYKKLLYCNNKADLSIELKELYGKNDYIAYDVVSQKHIKEINRLIKSGVILVETKASYNAKNKTKRMVCLLDNEKTPTSKKGKELVNYLKEIHKDVEKSVLINDMGFTNSVINTLQKNGIIEIYDEETYRKIRIPNAVNKKVLLNEEQQNVINSVLNKKNESHTFVLKGVTGSGKTEVYMNLIEDVLKRGKEAILLVPEISLTPQMTSRFQARFKDDVAVMHSGLSPMEKYDEWRKILKHDAKIVVGARSAIFAPFENLGIIIIDEAHEESYIQDNNPRYDAVEIAKIRSKTHNCPLILGSATPKVSEYYKALNLEQTLLEMNTRANKLELPESKIISLVDEIKKGNRSCFSKELQELMSSNLKNNLQTILFLNRRGFSSFVQCRACGEVVNCPHCDISLTYHKIGNKLKCHHCGYEQTMVSKCNVCESNLIKEVGSGTQKIELEVSKLFPQARVIRMDNDTMKQAKDYEDAFMKFKNKEADILIGTQMIAKGLDFEDVTLVGVLNADLAMKYPVYDSNEICYNLIEQVSGRAGRGNKPGKVIIQSYSPNHYSVVAAAKHDYNYFYDKEIENRLICKNPPFSMLVEIKVSSKTRSVSYKNAEIIKRYLENNKDKSQIFGPAEATIFRENDYYSYIINVKIEDDAIEKALSFIVKEYQDNKDCYVDIKRM